VELEASHGDMHAFKHSSSTHGISHTTGVNVLQKASGIDVGYTQWIKEMRNTKGVLLELTFLR
jgi:hypothetical protein